MEVNYRLVALAIGGLAILVGSLSIVSRKGRSLHKSVGKLFFLLMLLSVVLIGIHGYYANADLLLLVCTGTFYMGLSGVRSVKMKRPDKRVQHLPKIFDWVMVGVFSIVFIVFIISGFVKNIFLSEVVSLAGVMMLSFVIFDVYLFTRKFVKVRHRMSWLYKHLGRMLYCWTLLATALIGLYYNGQPNYLWLAPTLGMALVIGGFLRFYQVKYEG